MMEKVVMKKDESITKNHLIPQSNMGKWRPSRKTRKTHRNRTCECHPVKSQMQNLPLKRRRIDILRIISLKIVK